MAPALAQKLSYTDEVARSTAPLYPRVAKFYPEAQWRALNGTDKDFHTPFTQGYSQITAVTPGRAPMRRWGVVTISFTTSAFAPGSSTPSRLATMAMVVSTHPANAAPTRSVGEKRSPLPMLSFGASVSILEPEES